MEAFELYKNGYGYYTGKHGYPLDRRKAYQFFSQAANQGHSTSMAYLGLMHYGGDCVAKDFSKALYWFNKSFNTNREELSSAFYLGQMYFRGEAVQKDEDTSFKYYDFVTKNAPENIEIYGKANYMCGHIMLNHYGNAERAARYYSKAAEKGNIPEAWYNMGYLCEQGRLSDVPKNRITAVALSFYEKSAQCGFAQGMDATGRLYLSVNMTDEAEMWLRKAAEKGYKPAEDRLRIMKNPSGFGALKAARDLLKHLK